MLPRLSVSIASPIRLSLVAWMLAGCSPVPSAPAEPPTRFPDAERIVAIGDLHGDLAATRRALRLAGAIDEDDRWIGGPLVVVQTGDQTDRGGDEPEILELLSRLGAEASEAGGAVHVLNGNHELMNVDLDFRYVTEEGLRDFEGLGVVDPSDSVVMAMPAEARARAAAFRPGGPWARILARRNVAVLVGDSLFVHGGILPEHVDHGLERMNAEMRAWLRGETPRPEWSQGKDSPIWSRRFSDGVDPTEEPALLEVLERLDARRMIVGHTIQEDGIASFAEGRVWCIDVGMAAHYGDNPVQVLEIRGETVRVLSEP